MTPPDDVNRILAQLTSRIQAIVGPKLLGLYLTGSLVTGDFDLAVSDVDLIAVTSTDLTAAEIDALGNMHADIAGREPTWDNRIEVVYLTTDALRTFRIRSSTIAVTSPGEPFHTKEAGRDWLINWYILRTHGRPLVGPPPDILVDPIERAEVVQWVREHAAYWRDYAGDSRNSQVYATLTLCRALHTAATGEHTSKRRAARWVADRYPEWAPFLADTLRSWREDWYDDRVDPTLTRPDVRHFAHWAVDQIAGDAPINRVPSS